jgi:ribosome biogenesis GTPase A
VKIAAVHGGSASSSARTPVIGRLQKGRAILSEREQELRAREQELLDRLTCRAGALRPGRRAGRPARLREARAQLVGLFLLVIAGEFNSGKSSFINALLGERCCPRA